MTTEEMLAQVNEAIGDILIAGQSYRIGSRQLTRADLAELKNLRKTLMQESANADADIFAGAYVAIFDGR